MMENNEEPNANIKNKSKVGKEIEETKKVVEDVAKLAANIETGNIVGAAKNAAKLAKGKMGKKITKKILTRICICVMVFVIIISALLSVFDSVKEKLIELASNIGQVLKSFWNWLTDDYWIKLDDDIEYKTLDDTRSRSHQER